jgi:hypothetical protein
MIQKHKLVLPEWTKNLPNKTKITAKEIGSFFGYKSKTQVHKLVYKGEFPKHESSILPESLFRKKVSKKPTYYWTLATLRAYEIEQNKGID